MGKKKKEKAGKLEKPEKSGKKDKEAKLEKSGKKDKTEKPGKSEKKVKAEKSEKAGKKVKAEKLKKFGKSEMPEKSEEQKKPGKPDRFDGQEQLERQNVPGKSDKQEQTGITEGSEKTERQRQPEKKEAGPDIQRPGADADAVAAVFRALGDESRMKIIRLLSEKELCAMELLESVGVVQSTLSHHMKVLTETGVVACRKEGKKVFYSIRRETMDRIADWLRDGAGK